MRMSMIMLSLGFAVILIFSEAAYAGSGSTGCADLEIESVSPLSLPVKEYRDITVYIRNNGDEEATGIDAWLSAVSGGIYISKNRDYDPTICAGCKDIFKFTMKSSNYGDKELKLKLRYDNGCGRVTDYIKFSVDVEKTIKCIDCSRDIDIIKLEYQTDVAANEKFPLSVTVSNNGDVREFGVTITAELNGRKAKSEKFSINPREDVTKTLFLSAPRSEGNYELEITAGNPSGLDISTLEIKVLSKKLTLNVEPEISSDGFVHVSGRASVGEKALSGFARIYVDGSYLKSIRTKENGYYSTALKLAEGQHSIKVLAGGIEKTKKAEIVKESIPEELMSVIIVVKESEDTDTGFINIHASSKELDVSKYEGNILKVTIQNRKSIPKRFSISTDFPGNWVFVSGDEIVESGETSEFHIYFNPDEEGRFEGNIFIEEHGITIKTIPLSLYVGEEQVIFENGLPNAYWVIGMGFLLLIVLALSSFESGTRKTKPLEPEITKDVIGSLDYDETQGFQ